MKTNPADGRQSAKKRVALACVAREYSFGREKIRGFIDYYRKNFSWEICRNELLQPFVSPDELRNWDGDGVVAEIYTPDQADMFRSLSVPVVNMSSSLPARSIPSVRVDNHMIGRMAAEHLIERKIDNFAFAGPMDYLPARERYEGFSTVLEKAGSSCSVIRHAALSGDSPNDSEDPASPAALLEQIQGLKRPVGIMAFSDRVGYAILEVCRRLGLRCPEDVAVIGVDNDEIFCNLAYSSMTSIDPNGRRVGFEAAAMLDRLMNGIEPEPRQILIPPDRVVFRNSTDVIDSEYPEVATALRFIRNHADELFDVSNVLDVVSVSRRSLETKFRAEVGHGIYQEIRRVHTDRARRLLETTTWSAARIARESGFSSPDRMELTFRKLIGMSTSEYREQHMLKSED